MVECDVRIAADGVLVLAHDPQVTDVTGKVYPLADHPSDTLASLDLGAGAGVPQLSELVAWARQHCAVMADMKCEGFEIEANVVRALAPLPPAQKIVPGAGEESRTRFRALDPDLPLSFSLDGRSPDDLSEERFKQYLSTLTTDAVTWQYPLLTPERIEALHLHGFQVFAWTVDDIEIMRSLLAAGVDGIISNRADLLQTL